MFNRNAMANTLLSNDQSQHQTVNSKTITSGNNDLKLPPATMYPKTTKGSGKVIKWPQDNLESNHNTLNPMANRFNK